MRNVALHRTAFAFAFALALALALSGCSSSDDSKSDDGDGSGGAAGSGGSAGAAGSAGSGGTGGTGAAAGTAGAAGAGGAAGTAGGAGAPMLDYPLDDTLRINHLQAKGTHNSYHVAPALGIPDWQYTHAPLDVQLGQQGVRKFELDTYLASGGGIDVLHVPLIDPGTTCPTLTDCLTTMKAWSDANPAHHPLFVQIEPKDILPTDPEEYFSTIDGVILNVWTRERVITPDDVKGSAPTLREAVTTTGWPTLGESRGKVLFFVNDSGAWREAYTYGQTSLDGRAMFTEADVDDPYAAVIIVNGPEGGGQQEIQDAVTAGFIVRTRADGVPLSSDPQPRADAALSSGAQVISSDWPVPVAGETYFFEVPGGTPSRCNPVTAPPECTSEDIENPALF